MVWSSVAFIFSFSFKTLGRGDPIDNFIEIFQGGGDCPKPEKNKTQFLTFRRKEHFILVAFGSVLESTLQDPPPHFCPKFKNMGLPGK